MLKNIIAGLFFIGAFCTLIALGSWQLDRLAWKQKIINDLEALYAADVTENIYHYDDLIIKNDLVPFLYGTVEGHFDYANEILVGPKPYNDKIGYQVITLLNLRQGGNILVSRGFINVDEKDNVSNTYKSGTISVSGLIRQPDWTKFTPNNSPENNVWSKLDIAEIAKAKNIQQVAPVILYAEKMSQEFPNLTMQEQRWMPRNKHHQYAIFWFTMALVLCGLFGYYAYAQRRARKNQNLEN